MCERSETTFVDFMLSQSLQPAAPAALPSLLPGLTLRDGVATDFSYLAGIKYDCLQACPEAVFMSRRTAARDYAGSNIMLDLTQTFVSPFLKSQLLVAMHGNHPVGFCRSMRDVNHTAAGYPTEIDSLYVQPDLQRQGIGCQLLTAMCARLTSLRQPAFVRVCDEAPALQLYARYGRELQRMRYGRYQQVLFVFD